MSKNTACLYDFLFPASMGRHNPDGNVPMVKFVLKIAKCQKNYYFCEKTNQHNN